MDGIAAFFGGLLALLPGAQPAGAPQWSGYVEVDYVYVAAQSSGPIAALPAEAGETVAPGEVLFELDRARQEAALRAALARVEAARANAENLASGSRSEEVDVIRASLAKAEADLALARSQSERSDKLLAEGIVPPAKADADRASHKAAEAQVAQLRAQLKVAELPARDPQRVAAEATLAAAEADADQARAVLEDMTVHAPAAGRVERVFFNQGETVPAGTPVIAIEPEGGRKVKFYVPEAERGSLSLGQAVQVSCDGCAAPFEAHLSYFASDPQFTPPVIYSREERNRLTFLVEAKLPEDAHVLPGQPVTVSR